MIWPLRILAVASVLAGCWGINAFLERQFNPGHASSSAAWYQELFAPFGHAPLAAIAGLGAVIFGFSFAYAIYRDTTPDPLPEKLGGLAQAMRNRFYFDEIYEKLIAISHEALSKLADWFDRWIIAGLIVRGTHGTTEILGRALRLAQTGNLQTYVLLFVLGVTVVLYVFLVR